METTAPARRPGVAARRTGYIVAAVVNAAMLYVINVQPGWEAVPFLTGDVTQVLGLVNVGLTAGIAANLIYLAADPPWLRSTGDLVGALLGLAVSIQVFRVFPFDFEGQTVDWALIVRTVLIVAVVGTALAAIVHLVALLRRAAGR